MSGELAIKVCLHIHQKVIYQIRIIQERKKIETILESVPLKPYSSCGSFEDLPSMSQKPVSAIYSPQLIVQTCIRSCGLRINIYRIWCLTHVGLTDQTIAAAKIINVFLSTKVMSEEIRILWSFFIFRNSLWYCSIREIKGVFRVKDCILSSVTLQETPLFGSLETSWRWTIYQFL